MPSGKRNMFTKGDKRCFWFDDDGEPIDGGCRRGPRCNYAHPRDADWDNLPPSEYGPYINAKIPTRTRDYHDDSPIRSRRDVDNLPYGSKSSPPHRRRDRSRSRRSYSRSRSRSSSPLHRREHPSSDVASSRMSEDPEKSGSHPVSSSTTPTTNSFPRRKPPTGPSALNISISSGPSARPLPRRQSQSFSATTPTGPSADRLGSIPPPATPITPVYKPQSPTSATTSFPPQLQPPPPPPPPDNEPPAMPPPPPLPEFPKGLSLQNTVQPPEMSFEEKKKLWEGRTKLQASAMQAKQTLLSLENQYSDALFVIDSNFFSSLPEEDKIRLKNELTALVAERDTARQAVEDALNNLAAHGSWPVAPPLPKEGSTLEEGEEEETMTEAQKHEEIVLYVKELHDTVQQMSALLGDISELKKMPPLPAQIQEYYEEHNVDDRTSLNAMDVDQPVTGSSVSIFKSTPGLPSRKRRRLSSELDEHPSSSLLPPTTLTGTIAPPAIDPDLPTRAELDAFLDTLVRLEGLAVTVENDLTAHENDMREEFKHHASVVIEEAQASFDLKQRAAQAQIIAEAEAREAEMMGVKADAEALGGDVDVMAREVAALVEKVERMELEVVEKRREREEGLEKVMQIEQNLAAYHQTRTAQLSTIQTLEAALKAYTSRPPSPPLSPRLPAPTYVLHALEAPLIEAVRASVQPMVEEVRHDVDGMMQEKGREIVQGVWTSMQVVMNVLTAVSEKLDKSEGENQSEPSGNLSSL